MRHRGRHTIAGLAALLFVWTTTAAQGPRSVWSGVYTTEQAVAGETIYFERCVACHGDDLGGRERAPALAGRTFLEAWHGRTLRQLMERVEDMPPDAPVSGADAANVVAYLLYMSEMPAGSVTLPPDGARLAEITLERARP